MHFSRYCLFFALAWGMLSMAVFSVPMAMQMNPVHTIITDATTQPDNWQIRGNPDGLLPCGVGLCLASTIEKRARAILGIPISPELSAAYDRVVFDLSSTQLKSQAVASHSGIHSFISAHFISRTEEQTRLVESLTILKDEGGRSSNLVLTPWLDSAQEIRLIINTKQGETWKINSLRVYMVSLGTPYRVFHGLVLAGWLVSLLYLVNTFAVRSLVISTIWQRSLVTASVLFFVALTIVSVGNFPINVGAFIRLVQVWSVDHVRADFVPFWLNTEWVLHAGSHAVLSVYLYSFRRRLNIDDVGVAAINAAIAIGVECSQLGIPGRSGSLGDIVAALGGWFLVFSLLKGVIFLRRFD